MTSYFFGGAYEVTDGAVKKYYSFAGQTILRDENGLQYFLTDHLGSVVATLAPHCVRCSAGVTNDTGTLTSQQRYLPFGGVRTDVGTIVQTDYGYTGQRDLDEGMGGLMDYREAPRSAAERAAPASTRLILTTLPNLTALYQTPKTLKPGTATATD